MTANRVQPCLDDGDLRLYHGDALTVLQGLPSGIAQTCVTSPPYWGLRDYGTGQWTGGDEACDHQPPKQPEREFLDGSGRKGRNNQSWAVRDGTTFRDVCGKCGAQRVDSQLGLEATPTEYVTNMVALFREVRRVLRDDGTLWVNFGDSYAQTTQRHRYGAGAHGERGPEWVSEFSTAVAGLKPKDLVGIPWSVAKAMQQPYYTGRITAERDRVWLAATIDAEGSICGFHHTRADDGSIRTGVHVTITNASLALLDEAHRIWPTSRADHNPHGKGHLGKREMRRWIAHNVDDKALLLRELYPYLIAKRQQALLAWNFLEMSKVSKRIGKLTEGREAKARRSWIVHALSALNRGDAIDLPNWIAEPPSLFEPGWYLRSDIIWSKPNPMPESVTDRPTKAHEYLFLLSKQPKYFWDADAIREAAEYGYSETTNGRFNSRDANGEHVSRTVKPGDGAGGRNRRSVWTIPTEPFPEAHFATYPQLLVQPCILAGTSERGECVECGTPWRRVVERGELVGTDRGGNYTGRDIDPMVKRNGGTPGMAYENKTTGWEPSCSCIEQALHDDPTPAELVGRVQPQLVLDPFIGSGTTALVARKHGRRCIGIDLSAEYLEIAAKRTQQLSLLGLEAEPAPSLERHRGLTGGAYSPPGQTPHSNAREEAS